MQKVDVRKQVLRKFTTLRWIVLGPAKRTRANHMPNASHESSWSDAVSKHTVSNDATVAAFLSKNSKEEHKGGVFGQEEPCVICYEDMTYESISKLHCGHIFHRGVSTTLHKILFRLVCLRPLVVVCLPSLV